MKPTVQAKEWSEEFRKKFVGIESGFSDWLTPENAKIMKKWLSSTLAEARKEGIEEGKEIGYKNVGSWYKLPEYVVFKGQLGKGRGGCSVCGGKPVLIRGRYPHTPKRRICPTCTREVLESIMESCNNRTAYSVKDTL